MNKYNGIYRGTVVNNLDPMRLGRIQAIIPEASVLTPSIWCDALDAGCWQADGVF
jgi:hypothetical protein